MGTGQVEPYVVGRFGSMQVCYASPEVLPVLLSTSLISILSSEVAISIASKRSPPRRVKTNSWRVRGRFLAVSWQI